MFKKTAIAIALMLAIHIHAAASEESNHDKIKQLQEQIQKLSAELNDVKKCSSWTSEYVRCTIKHAPLRCVRSFAEMVQACENNEISDAWWRK